MDEQVLEKLGLTKGEIKVYLALNKLGESTIGPIGRESKVSKSKMYDILDKLIEKGLVGYISKDGTKYFIANDPHMILEYVDAKEKELQTTKQEVASFLPFLMLQRDTSMKHPKAEIYAGWTGIKAVRDELIKTYKPKGMFLTMGCPKAANDILEAYFLEFHKRRLKNKIGMKIIYNSDARVYGIIRTKMKNTEVRYLQKKFPSPHWIDIFPEAVLFVMVLQNPLAFVVRDAELASGFRSYFEVMWKNSVA